MIKNNTTIHQLDQLDFLCGSWKGIGTSINEDVIGTLEAEFRFQKSFIVLKEMLALKSGQIVHEDCTWIYFREKDQTFQATQFMSPGIVETKLVMLTETGCRWWMGPQAPWVDFIKLSPLEMNITISVPQRSEPETWIQYKKI